MKASVIKQRIVSDFILTEFVKGNLDTKEQIERMLNLVQSKLGMSIEQAGSFMRKAIGVNA